MKNKLLLALLLCCIKSFSQDSKFSVELSYPLPIDKNFIGHNYNGIVDLGIKYRFANLHSINIGGSLNGGIFKNTKADAVQPFDVTAYAIQPRIFAELNSKFLQKFHPSIGLGYIFLMFKSKNIQTFNPEEPMIITSSASENESGINLNLGTSYDITNKIFAIIQYDFIKITVEDEVPDTKYNTNINIIKIGIGLRL